METLQTGHILISEPFLEDPNFKQTVVILADYNNEDGAVGFVLNRKLDCVLSDLIPELKDFDAEVYAGGPVAMDTLHFIHNVGDLLDGSIKICSGVYWGGELEKLIFMIEAKLIAVDNIKFFLGYSGWSAGQLEEEYRERTWILSEMDANYLFRNNKQDLWKLTLEHKGGNFSALSDIQSDVILN